MASVGQVLRNKYFLPAAVVVIGLCLAILGPGQPYLYKIYCTHMPSCHYPSTGTPPPGSSEQSGPSGGSAYYQKGYASGKSGFARSNYGVGMGNMAYHPDEWEHNTCSEAVNSEVTGADYLDANNQDDFMQGCLQAFRDVPPTGGAKSGGLNPYR